MPAQKLRPRFCKAGAFTSWDRSSGARPTSSRVCSLLHVGSAPSDDWGAVLYWGPMQLQGLQLCNKSHMRQSQGTIA